MINVAHTWMVSPQTLNEANFGLVRQHGEAGDPTPETPNVGPGSGVNGFGVEFWHPIDFTQNNFQFKDTLTMNRGRHSFRTGAELRLGRDGATLHHWERPNYNFQSILDFIDDEPFGEDRAVDPATGLPTTAYGKYLTNEWAVFFQDNWKARPNLTLNLGLRYDNFGNPKKDQIPYNGIILGRGLDARRSRSRTRKVGNDRSALRDRLEQLRAAARHHVGSDLERKGGPARRRRHLLQPDQQHRLHRRAAQSAAVRACLRIGPGRHADRLLAGTELRAEHGARTWARRARRHSRRARRPASSSIPRSSSPSTTTGSPACSISCRGISSSKRTTADRRAGI